MTGPQPGTLLDQAEWAIVTTGVLDATPPIVIEALTFMVPPELTSRFAELTVDGAVPEVDTVGALVADACGVEFEQLSSPAVTGMEDPDRHAELVRSLLRDLVGAAGGSAAGVELAEELTAFRLPVFGSQSSSSEQILRWGGGAGEVLGAVGVLAGSHAPALLLLAGPAGAIITIGSVGLAAGTWTWNHFRRKRRTRKTQATTQPAAPKPGPAPSVTDPAATSEPTTTARNLDALRAHVQEHPPPPLKAQRKPTE